MVAGVPARRRGPREGELATVLIRDFRPEDLEAVAGLWLASWASTGLNRADAPKIDDLRMRLARESPSSWTIRLACAGPNIVGFVAYVPSDAWLRQLFVAPDSQGRGVGTQLLGAARDRMTDGFWLRTDAQNSKARRFYEHRGLILRDQAPHPDHGNIVATYVWRPFFAR